MNGFTDPEIEEAAISAMMQWQGCITEAQRRKITAEHFTSAPCRILLNLLYSEWQSGRLFDLILFTHKLRETDKLEAAGGASAVSHIYGDTCHSPNVIGYYLDIIEDRFAKRLVLKTCGDALRESESHIEGADLKQSTLEKIIAIPDPAQSKPERTLLEAVLDKIERMENGEPDADIIKTGITKLDMESPLRRGDMPLIAGERKAGKSILALTIAVNVARQGIPVLYFSLEDREPKIIDRMFAGVTRIGMRSHHVARLTPAQVNLASGAVDSLGKLPIHIKDDVFDLVEMVVTARLLKARCQIGLIIVDYAQLVRTVASKERRELEVATVSRTLRLLAMELDTPIILLSQLNADGLTRDSRALEQDATAMWLVKIDQDAPGERTIEIPWQRNGESGIGFKVTFLGEIARIENYYPNVAA